MIIMAEFNCYESIIIRCPCSDGLPYGRQYFGAGVDTIAMDEVTCLGDEAMLINCSYKVPRYDSHLEDAGVRCFSEPVPS